METKLDSSVHGSDGNESTTTSRRSLRPRKSLNIVAHEIVRRSRRNSTNSLSSTNSLNSTNSTEKTEIATNTQTKVKLKRGRKPIKKEAPPLKNEVCPIENEDENENHQCYDNLDIAKIVGATSDNGKLKFVFKWMDRDEPTLVSSDEANLKYPYVVIDYYESCMVWGSESGSPETTDSSLDE